jgi:hypothetical protein
MFHRGLIFGIPAAWAIVLAVFLFDLFFAQNGWCGHVCPVGAFYSLLAVRPLRVVAARRACERMDCCAVPGAEVIPALKGRRGRAMITSPNCQLRALHRRARTSSASGCATQPTNRARRRTTMTTENPGMKRSGWIRRRRARCLCVMRSRPT